MSFRFEAIPAPEHKNGTLVGTFFSSSNSPVKYSYYFDDADWLRFEGDKLYLGNDWHFDFETERLLQLKQIDFINVKPGESYQVSPGSTWRNNFNSIPIREIDLVSSNTLSWKNIQLEIADLSENISVTPIPFKGYEHGALVAELSSEGITTATFNFNHSFFEVQNKNIKLKEQYYYDPQLMRIIGGTQYWDIDSDVSGLTVISFEEGSARPNYFEKVYEDNIFNIFDQAIITDTTYFAGMSVIEKPKSGIATIDSLLFEDNNSWASNAKYANDTAKTVVTFSFIPNDPLLQKFVENYASPDPKIDQIIGFEERHKVAARQALDEWAKVANIHFLELDETAGNYGTIRFGFTDHEKNETTSGWATGPGTSAKSGDIWITEKEIPELYVKGISYNFKTLLHEIGHSLGLKHPFEGGDLIDTAFDFRNYTIMSYTEPEGSYYRDAGNTQYLISSTPMVYDIAAIQYLYGAAENNEGNTSYKYQKNQPFVEAIWDSGGYDTLDLAGFNKDCTINLIPGSYSTVVCNDWSMKDNLGIAQGAVLEKVVAGSGSDIITGNSADNHLIGNSGHDIISGNTGNDVIEGGFGNDILRGGLGADQFIFYLGDGQDTIKDFNVNEDEVHFYNSQGQPLAETQILLTQNSSGDAVYSTPGGTNVTLEGVSLSSVRDINRTSVQDKLEELQAKYDALMIQYNESLARIEELEAKLEVFTSKPSEVTDSPEALPTPEAVPAPTHTPEPEQPAPIPKPTPEPTPEPAQSYADPTGINKILVEKYGYEWVNGKAWAPGTAPEEGTHAPPEPDPIPEPETTPEPEQPDPTPAPTQTREPSPALNPELNLADIEDAPTGISKFLVEKYGYSWIEGQYYRKGTAPEVNLEGDAIHTVTVSKVGNQNVFFIDGNSNPDFVIEAGKTYRFDQSDVSNTNHPLNFLSEAGSDVTSYIEVSGTAGTEGAYIDLNFKTGDIANIDGPELSYYCEIHGTAMGNDIEVSNDVIA